MNSIYLTEEMNEKTVNPLITYHNNNNNCNKKKSVLLFLLFSYIFASYIPIRCFLKRKPCQLPYKKIALECFFSMLESMQVKNRAK